jgi:hypothetical protein
MACKVPPIELPPGHTFPPCEHREVSYIFDPKDFHIKIEGDTVVSLKPKRRGTYHGKRYDRPIITIRK